MPPLVSFQPFAGRLFILQSYNDSVWTRGEYPLDICGRASYQSNFTSQFNSVNAFSSGLHTITPHLYFTPFQGFLQSDSTRFFRFVRQYSSLFFSRTIILPKLLHFQMDRCYFPFYPQKRQAHSPHFSHPKQRRAFSKRFSVKSKHCTPFQCRQRQSNHPNSGTLLPLFIYFYQTRRS